MCLRFLESGENELMLFTFLLKPSLPDTQHDVFWPDKSMADASHAHLGRSAYLPGVRRREGAFTICLLHARGATGVLRLLISCASTTFLLMVPPA
jgi:hypothetical protein